VNDLKTPKNHLTRSVKDKAHQLGFDLVGITTPEAPAHIDVYSAWVAAGHHAEMSYLANDRALRRRSNPLEILPECQSILVVGMNYFPGEMGTSNLPKCSTYAMGQDYHDILLQGLQELMRFITELLGRSVPHRIYVDTGPLLERELAQRAGLGWIGKNSCLIHPRIGSYTFLGEILLGIELGIDPPFDADRCGSCSRCIDACPTSCILPNRTLDARRCISYLTIEHKGSIPRELRPLLGEWIFGCDICQQVCPWNLRFAQSSREIRFQPGPFLAQASLKSFLGLDLESFREHLKGSPLKRPKLRGILRNAAIVSGNQQDPGDIPKLVELLLNHPESLVRSHAAWALGCMGGEKVEILLREAQIVEKDLQVQEEIKLALEALDNNG
jgi:epoxyqueuosine reductase